LRERAGEKGLRESARQIAANTAKIRFAVALNAERAAAISAGSAPTIKSRASAPKRPDGNRFAPSHLRAFA
jgi:hypothetical protein